MATLLQTKRLIWGVVLLLVTLVAALSYFSGRKYLATVEAVEQTLAVQSEIDGTLSLLKDAETGNRGYLLTTDEEFLEPYYSAIEGIPRRIAELQHITGDDPAQQAPLHELQHLTQQKISFIAESIHLHGSGDTTAALERVRSKQGKRLMDAIRAICKRMLAHEQAELDQRRSEARAAQTTAVWLIGAGTMLTVLLTLGALLTVHRDVTELQSTAEQLAASEEHFRLLTENGNDLVRLLDPQGKTTYVSPSVERLLGYGIEEFMALPALHLLHPDETALAASIVADARNGLLSGGQSTYRLRHKSGEYRFFEVRWSVQRDVRGVVVSLHTAGRDVTERQEALEQLNEHAKRLRDLSLRDELTQLYNRRGFLEVANQARLQSQRDGRRAALVFIDLNGMKRINDELGHEVGDDLLRDAADVIRHSMRDADVVARLGGDEFVIFSLDLDDSGLEALRKRLRERADALVAERARPYRISMSVGAAYNEPASGRSLEDLLEIADAAMYETKRARQAAGGVSLLPPSS
jgi:diguanylate cyclase (GGDEF)-like protein/PAS domain S-box-containing protein